MDSVSPLNFKNVKYVPPPVPEELETPNLMDDVIHGIMEAQKIARKNDIRANTVLINRKFFKVREHIYNFCYELNGQTFHTTDLSSVPPMIGGLAAYFTDEIPEEVAFLVCKGPAAENARLRRENDELREQIRQIKEALGITDTD